MCKDVGNHLEMMAAFVRSYDFVPAGAGLFALGGVELMTQSFAHVFVLGLKMSAPLVAMGFIINLLFAILGRVAPKCNVLVLSFGARIVFGLLLLVLTVKLITEYMLTEATGIPERMLEFIVS